MSLFAAGLALAAVSCGSLPSPLVNPDVDGNELMRDLVTLADFSGAVRVTRQGQVVFESSAGTSDGARPFLPETPSDSGSLAKPMMAEIILGLVADGTLSLDDTVQQWAPDYPYPDTRVRDLLDHSAALPDYGAFQDLLDAGNPVTTRDLLIALAGMERAPPAAGTFSYCNLCYDTLGLVAEAAAAKPLPDLFRERIFEPAAMDSAFLRPARFADWPGVRTRGFRPTPEGPEPFDAFDNEGFHGASNIYLSVRDASAYAEHWAFMDDAKGLSHLALAPGAEPGFGYTRGSWSCAPGNTRCHYTGHHQGFDTFAYWDSEAGITAAFVSNGGLAPFYQTGLARALIALGEGRPARLAPDEDAPLPEGLSGWFQDENGARFEVLPREQGLSVRPEGGLTYPAYPAGKGVLYVPGLDLFLSGSRAESGPAFTARSIHDPPKTFRGIEPPVQQ